MASSLVISVFLVFLFAVNYFQPSIARQLGAVKNNTVRVTVSAEIVSDICSHTADHAFCITLLNFPPSTAISDLHTLSVNVNNFALITSVYTLADVIELVDKATPDLIEQFATCVGNWHGGILGEMYKVEGDLHDSNYIYANQNTLYALGNVSECEHVFWKPPEVIKSPLTEKNTIMTNILSVLAVITKRLRDGS